MPKPNYSLCDRTVTIYRRLADGKILRRRIDGCFYNWQTQGSPRRYSRKFLLVIPGEETQVLVGDRVYDGQGPLAEEVSWDSFVPAAVEGLSQVEWVRPWYYGGEICHMEAGSN